MQPKPAYYTTIKIVCGLTIGLLSTIILGEIATSIFPSRDGWIPMVILSAALLYKAVKSLPDYKKRPLWVTAAVTNLLIMLAVLLY